ncbi:zygote arrest protein 1 isoform 2-T2 [Thomomys bottae]
MATLGAEVLGANMYPACAPCAYPVPGPLAAAGKAVAAADGWWLRAGGSSTSAATAAASSFPSCAQPTAADSLDGLRRAQLLALLSRMSAGVGARPRGVGSREVAVQVTPRRDAAVQCSLGRRPLPRRPRTPASPQPAPDPGAPASPQPARRGPAPGSLAGGGPRPARLPRTVAVFSPVPRRLMAFREAERGPEGAARETPRRPRAEEKEGEEEEKDKAAQALGASRETWGARPPAEAGEDAAAPSPAPARDGDGGVSAEEAPELELGAERLPFQVYFKQFCRTCQKSYNPYRVEDITCQSCKRTRCSCPVRLRHVDPKRPHRQDLCGRCKGKRLSCDSTFSFKYII